MITYVTGDLLKSNAECLVNTVNCEGYMGKGIAYQFKMAYPENNKEYVKACKSGRLYIGTLHYFSEKGKLIVNFPTKDKWRSKSKIEYIDIGLDNLVRLIQDSNIKSIAIPPLGSGNGGLEWSSVKDLIEQKLELIFIKDVNIIVYEPSKNYISKPMMEPKISLSALVLMLIKFNLKRFNMFRLQKTAFLIDIYLSKNYKEYFKFEKYKYGPYDHALEVISQKIKEFQMYYNVANTEEAYDIAYKKLASSSVDSKLKLFTPIIDKATKYVNNIESDTDLECITTVLFIIKEKGTVPESDIVNDFKMWSEDKANRFSDIDITKGIQYLYTTGMIEKSLMGYTLSTTL